MSTILGIDSRRVHEAVGGVHTTERIAEALALVTWSVLAEPGDSVAGALVGALGASEALRLLLDENTSGWAAMLAKASGSAIAKGQVESAVARWQPRLRSDEVMAALERAARVGASLVLPEDRDWPAGFADLGNHGPHVLWCRGSRRALSDLSRSTAVVGARSSTEYGASVTADLVDGLIGYRSLIVSGGAYGIDAAAHRTALAVGGTTVAFLAGGVDRLYPPRNESLLQAIMRDGAVLSEMPIGSSPTRWRFLQRNRLIAAASSAVIVVEAGIRSGSINTANHASMLGRPLGAVPGPVTSPASAGCHMLLRERGAVCVTRAEDVVELQGWELPNPAVSDYGELSSVTRVLDAVTPRGKTAADLAALSGLSVSETQSVLGLLELEGVVVAANGMWRRAAGH